jgi:hypothetical protein
VDRIAHSQTSARSLRSLHKPCADLTSSPHQFSLEQFPKLQRCVLLNQNHYTNTITSIIASAREYLFRPSLRSASNIDARNFSGLAMLKQSLILHFP